MSEFFKKTLASPGSRFLPQWQQLTLVNPLRYFLVILCGVFLQGTPFHLLISQFWPMALIGLANVALRHGAIAISAAFALRQSGRGREAQRRCGGNEHASQQVSHV